MDKLVQWMTLQQLRDDLERARPAWEAVDLDDVLAHGQLLRPPRTPTVTSWLTSSIMQIWGAHFLGPEGQVNTSGRVTRCERPSGDLTLQVHPHGRGWLA